VSAGYKTAGQDFDVLLEQYIGRAHKAAATGYRVVDSDLKDIYEKHQAGVNNNYGVTGFTSNGADIGHIFSKRYSTITYRSSYRKGGEHSYAYRYVDIMGNPPITKTWTSFEYRGKDNKILCICWTTYLAAVQYNIGSAYFDPISLVPKYHHMIPRILPRKYLENEVVCFPCVIGEGADKGIINVYEVAVGLSVDCIIMHPQSLLAFRGTTHSRIATDHLQIATKKGHGKQFAHIPGETKYDISDMDIDFFKSTNYIIALGYS
jgi:hypothetical protein